MTYTIGAEKYYDLFGYKNDASFYINLASKYNKALELGVGTARLAIQLAQAGIEVWGIDNSPFMLRAAESNLRREIPEIQNRIHLLLADVRNFELGERFEFIYFPSFSYDHLLTSEEQFSTLQSIRKHLTPTGVYVFDLAHYTLLKATSTLFVQRKLLDKHRKVIRVGLKRIKPKERLMSIDLWYELYEDGSMIDRYHEGGDVFIHSPKGIQEVLEDNGFKIIKWYGGYDGRSFTETSELMILVTQLKHVH
ncbi:MAG: class I SAM-dependent methyltransferase [Candidatus Hodarchaeota archaeon]